MREITTLEELDSLLGSGEPTILFKYSPTCGISHVAEEAWSAFCREELPGITYARCDVLGARPAARGVSERIGVLHQSPQVLALRGGRCLAHTSHYSIRTDWLESTAKSLLES